MSLSLTTVKIAQAGVPTLRILDDKGDTIDSDVYGLEVIVWNSGDLSLGSSSDRVRKPLTITFTAPVRILGAVVQDSRNIDISDIQLPVDSEHQSVSVVWRQFDPTDAIKLFITYTGSHQSPIEYSGRIIGSHLIIVSEYKETAPDASGLNKIYRGFIYDWENKRIKAILTVLAFSLQFVALIVMVITRSRTAWAPVLMVFAIICMVFSTTSFLSPKIPF